MCVEVHNEKGEPYPISQTTTKFFDTQLPKAQVEYKNWREGQKNF